MKEYFFKVREMENSEPHMDDEEFYSDEKRYISEPIQRMGRDNMEQYIFKNIRNLARTLVRKDPHVPIWITVEREELKPKS